jgi:predicted Ser/Thr protein kinase
MASPTATGSLLAGRYRVLERLGSGGMATVYLAEDERLGRRVAVKRLHAGSPEDTAKRFAREARIGASLNHENVVTVYDTVTEEGTVVIVMEHVDGESLADALRRGRLEPHRAVEVLRGVAAALGHAHQNGIVHRDVKPANILLARDGTVKLADLGIATAVEGTRITQSGSVMGTAAYMAPEQLDGREAGTPADTYALAAVAYEMLTGRPAYRGGSPVEVAHQVVSGPPPDLHGAWQDAPKAAADAIARAMAFEPGDRPRSPLAFVDELAAALAPEPEARTAALPRSGRSSANPSPVTRHPSPLTRPPRPDHRNRGLPLLGLLALVLLGGALAVALLGGGDDGKGGGDSGALTKAEKQARAERRRKRREERAQAQRQEPATPAPAAPAPADEPQPDQGGSYAIPQPSGTNDDEAGRLQLQGHQMLESDPEGAVKVLERSIEAFTPGTDDIRYQYALYSLGRGLRLSGRPEDAIPVLELRLKHPNQRDTVQQELDAAKQDAAG